MERNAYVTGPLANTNLDDNKSTKRRMLENVDNDYQNSLRSIYNIDIEDDIQFDQNPLFKAMKIPGTDIPVEATDIDRTTDNLETDYDQGG